MIIVKTYSEIVTPELLAGNIDNNNHNGFLQDYRVLHCLLRKYQPKMVMEIGTNIGTGTAIICNVLKEGKVYSLDLPYSEGIDISKQYPLGENMTDRVGSACKFPYEQLRGNSLKFDFSPYPCEAWFIDGEHTYLNVRHESQMAVNQKAKLIIFHDADIEAVMSAIEDTFRNYYGVYQLYRVSDTRIVYALKNGIE